MPTEELQLTSYVEEALPALGLRSPVVRTLKPVRTFWEKILVLHKLAHQPNDKPIRQRMSRHYYDILMLAKHHFIEQALGELPLLEKVVKHNVAYFRSAQASYDDVLEGTVKLLPDEEQLVNLRQDYQAMNSMFILEPPSFQELIAELKKVETTLKTELAKE